MAKRQTTGWITLRGSSGYPDIEQPEQDWFDCSGHNFGQVEVLLSQLSGATLTLQGAERNNQYFATNLTATDLSSTLHVLYLNRQVPPGDTDRLNDVLKWVVNGSGNWEACFRVVVNLK